MFLHKRISLVVGLFCALIATFFVASPHTHAQALQAQQATTNTYNVTIQGSIDNGLATFTNTGTLVINVPASQGSSNQFDLCLNTGGSEVALSGNANVGDISLNSQTGCFPGAFTTSVDLGSVTFDSQTNTATLQVVPLASVLEANVIDTTGIGFESIISGGMSLQFTDQGVNGQIQVGASDSAFNPEQPDTYTATVTGTLVS